MARAVLKCLVQRGKNFLFTKNKQLPAIEYWEKRVEQYGKRAVLNIGHPEEEMDMITQMQKDTIFPFLKECLRGTEKLALDLGCGPGRFTSDLATIIHGYAIGVDPIKYLIDLAPKNENVEYR